MPTPLSPSDLDRLEASAIISTTTLHSKTLLSLVAMARQAPRWISVEERLPESQRRVVAWTNLGTPEIATWTGYGWVILWPPGEDAIGPGDVVAWMDLPEPPK